MEHVLEMFVAKLLEHGPWGIIVGWLMFQNYRKDCQLESHLGSIEKIQERRAQEREKNSDVMMASSAALVRLSDAVNGMSEDAKDSSDRLGASITALNEVSNKLAGLQSTIMTDIQNRGRRRV